MFCSFQITLAVTGRVKFPGRAGCTSVLTTVVSIHLCWEQSLGKSYDGLRLRSVKIISFIKFWDMFKFIMCKIYRAWFGVANNRVKPHHDSTAYVKVFIFNICRNSSNNKWQSETYQCGKCKLVWYLVIYINLFTEIVHISQSCILDDAMNSENFGNIL